MHPQKPSEPRTNHGACKGRRSSLTTKLRLRTSKCSRWCSARNKILLNRHDASTNTQAITPACNPRLELQAEKDTMRKENNNTSNHSYVANYYAQTSHYNYMHINNKTQIHGHNWKYSKWRCQVWSGSPHRVDLCCSTVQRCSYKLPWGYSSLIDYRKMWDTFWIPRDLRVMSQQRLHSRNSAAV